jgi:hypothetical protein
VKQCAVLFLDSRGQTPQARELRDMGFVVHECLEWPDDGAVREYHVVIVRTHAIAEAPMLAARLRAKPHFGRRLLLSLVDRRTSPQVRRSLEASGFDDVLDECSTGRELATRILRALRRRPELRCMLPPLRTRSAA